MKYSIFLLVTAIGMAIPHFIVAQGITLNLDYPQFGPFDLNTNQSLPEIIGFFYYFIVGIAGLAAFVMLVWGGVQWLTSGAIPSQASEARDKIRNAIIGLLLILASFLIIQVINPELTIIRGTSLIDPCTDPANAAKCTPGTVIIPALVTGGSVVLNADGEPDLLCIQSSSSALVQLQWTSSNSGCQADSNPLTSPWTGARLTSGTEDITLAAGTFNFTLSCSGTTDFVKVTVIAGSCTGGTQITVDLKARDSGAPVGSGTDDPITFDTFNSANNDIPSGNIALDWTSSAGTASCNTEGVFPSAFTEVGRPPSGTFQESISSLIPGTYPYTITCIDTTGTQSATDSVNLIVI